MKHFIMILFAAVITFTLSCAADDGIKVINVQEFADAVKTDTTAVILDVRTADEFAECHIAGAVNLDVKDDAAFNDGVKNFDECKTYYVYCRSGRRSHKAATIIKAAGFNAIDMDGGITAWKDAKMPVETSTEKAL